MPTPNDSRSSSLRFLECPLVGAWIATIVVMWVVIAGVQEYPSVAREVASFVRNRIALGEACIGSFLILLQLRRSAPGGEIVRSFLAVAALVASSLWLAPGLRHLEERLPALSGAEAAAITERVQLLRLALGSFDALRAVVLFSLLSRELRDAGEQT